MPFADSAIEIRGLDARLSQLQPLCCALFGAPQRLHGMRPRATQQCVPCVDSSMHLEKKTWVAPTMVVVHAMTTHVHLIQFI